MDPSIEPPPGLAYHELQRAGWPGRWRPVLGAVIFILGLILVAPLILQAGFAAYFAARGQDVTHALDRLGDSAHATPATLAYVNLSLAAAIPLAIVLSRVLHGLGPGWVASVLGRIRWRWLLVCLGLAVVTLVVTVVVSEVLPDSGDGSQVGGSVNSFTSTSLDFVLVIVLLTPLQAAGEEYLFRGYLTQAFGGVVRSPALSRATAVGVPAVLFALAHGSQDVPLFFDRLAFGIVAGMLVILTGGLEAGIAMHVLNNFLAFGAALAFGNISTTLATTSGSWWNIPVTLTQSLVYLGLTVWAARRSGVATVTPARGGVPDFVSDAPRL